MNNTADRLTQEFLPEYNKGEDKFYRFLLFYAIVKLCFSKKATPHTDFLDSSKQFLILYRQTGESNYLNMSRLFRKAGHKIYRVLYKNKKITFDPQFFNRIV